MDPLTICTTVAGLVKTCGATVITCKGLLGTYKNAPQTLASIRTECTTIKTALSQVDWLVKRDNELLSSQLEASSPLAETLDVALTGCAVTFSLLDIELRKLYDTSKDLDGYKWKDKMRYVWNEDRAKRILDQMRGLQSAIGLVLTALQTSSLSALAPLLRDQKPVIERVRQNTRSTHKSLSLELGLTADVDRQASSKDYSIFNSSIGDEEFSFDDEIINSFAYRNAIKRLASKAKATQQSAKPDERHILDEPLIDLEEQPQSHNEPKTSFTAFSSHHCLSPAMTFTYTDLLSDAVVEDLTSLMPTSIGSPSHQPNARATDDDPSSRSWTDASASEEKTKVDVRKPVKQRGRDSRYRLARTLCRFPRVPVQAPVDPARRFHLGSNITVAAVDGLDNGVPPMPVFSELSSTDITPNSISSAQTETPPWPWEHSQKADSVGQPVVRSVTRGSARAISLSPGKPVSLSGMLGTNDSNISSVTFRPIPNELRCDPVPERLRNRVKRATHEGQYDRTVKSKSSEIEGVPDSNLVAEFNDSDSKTERKDEIFIENDMYNNEKTSRKKISSRQPPIDPAPQSSSSVAILTEKDLLINEKIPRKKKRSRQPPIDPAPQGFSSASPTAAAPEQLEREHSSSSQKIGSSTPKQTYQTRRIKNNIMDSRQDVPLLSHSAPKRSDVVASKDSINTNLGLPEFVECSTKEPIKPELEPQAEPGIASPVLYHALSHRKSSINANPRLLETMEDAIRRLIMPELETLKKMQKMKQNRQRFDRDSKGSADKTGSSTPKQKSRRRRTKNNDPDSEYNASFLSNSMPNSFSNGAENDTSIREEVDLGADVSRPENRTCYSIPEDGSPVTIPIKKRKDPGDKACEAALGQTSLLIEYFEAEEGPSLHTRPNVRVKITPSAARSIKDENEHIQVIASKGNRKPSYTRRIWLDPLSRGERQLTESAKDGSGSSNTSATQE